MDEQLSNHDTEAAAPGSWPKPVGVTSLVLGILAVSCGVLGLPIALATEPAMNSMFSSQLPPNTPPPPFMPPFDAVTYISMGIGVVLNIILIVAALKLMRREQSGRSLHLVYAVVGIIAAFVGSYAGYHQQQQHAAEKTAWAEQHGNANDFTKSMAQQYKNEQAFQGTANAVGLVFGLVVALAWPVFCIIWFGMVKRTVPPAFEF